MHNFQRPQSPRLIELPPGRGPIFRKVVSELAEFIESGLRKALESEPIGSQLAGIREAIEAAVRR